MVWDGLNNLDGLGQFGRSRWFYYGWFGQGGVNEVNNTASLTNVTTVVCCAVCQRYLACAKRWRELPKVLARVSSTVGK